MKSDPHGRDRRRHHQLTVSPPCVCSVVELSKAHGCVTQDAVLGHEGQISLAINVLVYNGFPYIRAGISSLMARKH